MRRILAFLLVFAMILPFPTYASKVDTKKKELTNVKGSIEASKKKLDETKKEKEAVQSELKSIDNNIVKVEQQLQDINQKLEVKEAELKKSEKELEVAIEEKNSQYEKSKQRIESMYKNKNIGYLQIIFSSKNFWEMLNRVEYIKKIAEYDQVMLEKIKQKEEEVATRTEKLEAEKNGIALMYKEQISIKSKLEETREQKDSTLDNLAKDEERLQSQIKDMIKISADLEKEVQRLISQSTLKYTGGKFLWPVPGHYRISSNYNPRNSPISGRYEFHTGIDIPAPFGKPVVAAAAGKVITAGWVNGYGNTVMIDHGSGYVTLYGHNSSLTVTRGQMVERGAQIARIGSTGYSTGNHCHFEVRLNGAHKNPHNYLK